MFEKNLHHLAVTLLYSEVQCRQSGFFPLVVDVWLDLAQVFQMHFLRTLSGRKFKEDGQVLGVVVGVVSEKIFHAIVHEEVQPMDDGLASVLSGAIKDRVIVEKATDVPKSLEEIRLSVAEKFVYCLYM
ncbi:hypothetical protein BFW01_g9979 [Lasiodiplodia theobromae]|nr:hypothetical protein BFW01_g9979 [Lasiodiplodia theobromae]